MQRKKIVILCDSPTLHTGFAKVLREIWIPLHATGKYEIHCLALLEINDAEMIPFPIYTLPQKDHLSKYIDQIKPNLVWTCTDISMIYSIKEVENRNLFQWVSYFPIEGEPLPTDWSSILENMDRVVAFGQYGMRVIRQRAPKATLSYIYHGVNPQVFRPLPEEKKIEIKNELGIDPSKTLIGVVARNQPRKAFDKLFEAFFYLVSGAFIQCLVCHKISIYPHDLVSNLFTPLRCCKHCHSENCKKGNLRDDLRLYIHAASLDLGWDLFDLQRDYHLMGKVYLNPELKVGLGISEEKLNEVYNTFDIFTLPTKGEGFGLPILEAMSAGVPIVVTDYSAHPEWAKGCGELVLPITLEAEPITNIRRAVIDRDQYVEALLKLIDNPKLRREYGAKGREIALAMDWKEICKDWEKLIDETLSLKESF